jgi:hypothetical protein
MRDLKVRRFVAAFMAMWLVYAPVKALAGSMTLLGAGVPGAAPTYTGPGDLALSAGNATTWGSCARVYKVALAVTSTSLCDLVAVTGGAAVGTLRASATGFVDLSAYFAGSLTPAAACAAASGGACKVTKIYNQITPGTLDFTQATLSNMPTLTFSAINGLPGMAFTNAASSVIQTATTTQAPPYSVSAVWKRTTAGNLVGACGGNNGGYVGNPTTANEATFQAPSNNVTTGATISDNAYHAVQGVSVAGANNSFVTPDGADTAGTTSGTISAASIRFGRASGSASLDGTIMECGLWAAAFTSGDRTSINSNQHGTNGYNF